MSDQHTNPDHPEQSAPAEESTDSISFDFAAAEDVMAEPGPPRRVLTIPPASSKDDAPADPAPAATTDAAELDAEMAKEVDALLDAPLPYESVDESIPIATPSPTPARTKNASPEPEAALKEAAPSQFASENPKNEPANSPSQNAERKTRGQPDVADAESSATQPVEAASSLSPLVRVLMIVNFPLRLVPQKLRLAVDVVALSLLFWAPVVWGLAMFVFKQSD